MKKSFFIALLLASPITWARQGGVSASYHDCVEKAKQNFNECQELAKEILSEASQTGLTTTQHALNQGQKLDQGGCKELLDKDIKKCAKR